MKTDDKSEQTKRIFEIFGRYFPGHTPNEAEILFMEPEWLLAGQMFPHMRKDDPDKLDQFGQAVSQVCEAYDALSYSTRSAISEVFRERYQDHKEPLQPHVLVGRDLYRQLAHLHRAIHGSFPKRLQEILQLEPEEGALEMALDKLRGYPAIKPLGATLARDQKAQLVKVAREFWEDYTGKVPPAKSETSAFTDFVQDLIELAGKLDEPGWKVETVMSAWEDYSKGE